MPDILIFDDDPSISNLMREVLVSLGLEVKCFPDGSNALLRIREEKPRLVLVDLMMPGMDGISISMMVKNDPAVAGTKMVVVTGKSFKEDRDRAMNVAGADYFLEKPFDVDQFEKVIRGLISIAPPKP